MTAPLARLPLAMTPLAFLLLATAATGNYRLVMIAAGTIAEVLIALSGGVLRSAVVRFCVVPAAWF